MNEATETRCGERHAEAVELRRGCQGMLSGKRKAQARQDLRHEGSWASLVQRKICRQRAWGKACGEGEEQTTLQSHDQ